MSMSDIEAKAEGVAFNAANPYELHQTPPAPPPKAAGPCLANPLPLGLFSFGSTVLLLSLINAHARHLATPNIIVGMAFSLGGMAQFIAGIMGFLCGSAFATTAFCSYGAFWLSLGLLFWPSSGMITAYEGNGLNDALGLFMIVWLIFTLLIFPPTFKTSVALVSLFANLIVLLILLASGYLMAGSVPVLKAAGWYGVIVGMNAYYVAAHALYDSEDSPFKLPNRSLA